MNEIEIASRAFAYAKARFPIESPDFPSVIALHTQLRGLVATAYADALRDANREAAERAALRKP